MARPKSKIELVELSIKNFEKLIQFIDQLSHEIQLKEFPKGTLNRNICDVLAHLHHWHLMMKEWYEVGMKGDKPAMPATGYTWKTVPKLNKTIWEKYRTENLKEIKTLLRASFEEIQNLIDAHSNEELFEKKRYKWTGSTSLGAYFISATSSHYEWAFKLIKKSVVLN